MKRVAIIQARMGSTRLPGKVLADIAGRPMLARVVERVRTCADIDDVVIATTERSDDDPVAGLAGELSVQCHRGSTDDVLSRYVGAARASNADVIVRVTADCPLLDPGVVGRVVRALLEDPPCDYAANVLERTYPRGLDAEAFHADVLERTDRLARSRRSREHVTYFIYGERSDLWLLRSVVGPDDASDLRWTVDTEDDLRLARTLYRELDLGTQPLDHRAVVAHVRAHPALGAMNAHVTQPT